MSFATLCGGFRVGEHVRIVDQAEGESSDGVVYEIRDFELRDDTGIRKVSDDGDASTVMVAFLVPVRNLTIGRLGRHWRLVARLKHADDAITRLGKLS